MNNRYRLLSFLVAIAIMITTLPLVSSAAEDIGADDIFLFGSYPQSEVKNDQLLSSLNSIELQWKSYDYYCGTGKWNDGKMHIADYMQYADVNLDGNKYRAVRFDSYRPYFSGFESTTDGDTYQDNNGYECGKIYWFSYEPLKWRIVDEKSGYAICDSIIDSQPFQNMIFYNGWEYFADYQYYDWSNYYVVSSIRNMLNNEFLNCAFTAEEKENLEYNYIDDLWAAFEDRVFLPSVNEVKNSQNQERIATGTDYAKCQGLFVDGGNSYWYLRTPGDNCYTAVCVSADGSLYGHDFYCNRYPFFTYFTGTGIRPAIKIKNLNADSVTFTQNTAARPEIPEWAELSVFSLIRNFFKNIFNITDYFITPACDENADIALNINRGINMPCMESGFARDYIMEKETFENVRNKGFDFIRLPVNFGWMLDFDGRLNESAMRNLDTVLKLALESDLTVLLDLHGWSDFTENPDAQNIERLISIWEHVAERYADYSKKLCFEILNEPNNDSDKLSDIKWNYIQLSTVAAIRKIDDDRTVVLSPMNWNSAHKLSSMLVNRSDKNIVIDVHNYEPMNFTHQGAEWLDGAYKEKIPFSKDMLDIFEQALTVAEEYQKKTGIKVIVGEFGVYEKQVSEEDVSQFLSGAVKLMKKHNLSWAYWEYNAGFGAFDYAKKEWKPFVANALLQ
ncbi:MAG: glycoside hydrolase family 5 protein [Clostridia bacterium]|nr:glycoside hydrolase family 5 protein [Clostridia bacterium]